MRTTARTLAPLIATGLVLTAPLAPALASSAPAPGRVRRHPSPPNWADHGRDARTLVANADAAMYGAKREGRGYERFVDRFHKNARAWVAGKPKAVRSRRPHRKRNVGIHMRRRGRSSRPRHGAHFTGAARHDLGRVVADASPLPRGDTHGRRPGARSAA